MSDADTLDRLVGEILARLFCVTVGGPEGPTAAAARDEWYRERYAALTARWLPAPPQARTTLVAARVAHRYRQRYGAEDRLPGAVSRGGTKGW